MNGLFSSNRTTGQDRTFAGHVRPLPPHTGTGQTGHTPLGVSGCPVRSGNPIDCIDGFQHPVEKVLPGGLFNAGAWRRDMSSDLKFLKTKSPNSTTNGMSR